MKRLLVLAYFFPPLGGGGTQRTVKLVRHLEAFGWTSTVLTTRDPRYWVLDPSLLEDVPASTEVLRVGGWSPYRGLSLLGRLGVRLERPQGERRARAFEIMRRAQSWFAIPDGYSGWARAARRAGAARIRAGGVDAIWTTSSPESAHRAGLALRRAHGVPWVADFRDPWVGRITYRPPTAWHDRTIRALERSVIEGADRITMVSEALVETYRARYPRIPAEKFVVLPNGVDSDDWRRVEQAERATPPGAPDPDRGRFVLLHAGQLAPRPSVRTLLRALRLVLDRDERAARDLRLRFVGGTEALAERTVRRDGLDGVIEIRPAVPHGTALAAMRRAGALLILGLGPEADSLLYTGKIYEYLTSGRPVLGVLDAGPAARLLLRAGGGVVVPTHDPEAVARAIADLLRRWRAGENLAVRVDPQLAETWERSRIAAAAARLLDSLQAPPALA